MTQTETADPRATEACRRAVRIRPEPGQAGAARASCSCGRQGDGHLAPPETRQGARRSRPRRSQRAVPLPDGYEVVLGNGGTTAFWDAAAADSSASARCTSRTVSSPRSLREHARRPVPRGFGRDRAADPDDAPDPAAMTRPRPGM